MYISLYRTLRNISTNTWCHICTGRAGGSGDQFLGQAAVCAVDARVGHDADAQGLERRLGAVAGIFEFIDMNIYIFKCSDICIHVNTYINVYIVMFMYTFICLRPFVYLNVCIHSFACMQVRFVILFSSVIPISLRVNIDMAKTAFSYMMVSIYLSIYLYIYIHTYIHIHIYIYIYIYIYICILGGT